MSLLFVSSSSQADVDVKELNPPVKVTGLLGKALGSRLIVEGKFAERVLLGNPLLVEQVNGTALDQAIPIEVKGKLKIEKSARYKLEGYEAGCFGGPPAWTSEDTLPQQTFQFRSIFVVTKILKVDPKQKE